MIALPRSLTARVTALFVLIVALAAVGLGAYLYGVLVDEIVRRDDSQLRGKLRQIQTVLSRPGAAELLRTQPDFFRDTMSGQENSLVRIVAADGAVLADINASGERYPVPAPPAAMAGQAGVPPGGAIIDWRSSRGEPGRVLAGAARLGQAEVTVVVARLYGERSAMLAQYRQRIAGAAAVSALVAALCAAGMLHRGLRPLRRMAHHAALLRPGTLAQPLEVPGAPSELQPLIDALNAMQTRLHEGYERLSGFSADLAHEFRTPVTNLLGQSQVMLAQPRSSADYEQLIASNIEEFERLARMIESILFLARAGQDDVLLARQPLPALDTLHKVADFYEGLAGECGVEIVCTGDAVVLADPHLLLRALANLVSNALRYAEPGSSVVLQALAQPGSTAISVTNQGAPIAPAHLPHLFERFYRADAARSHGDGSTGLGLAIVSAIMALHRGTASVRSDAGGTCFTLTFHAAVSDPSSTV